MLQSHRICLVSRHEHGLRRIVREREEDGRESTWYLIFNFSEIFMQSRTMASLVDSNNANWFVNCIPSQCTERAPLAYRWHTACSDIGEGTLLATCVRIIERDHHRNQFVLHVVGVCFSRFRFVSFRVPFCVFYAPLESCIHFAWAIHCHSFEFIYLYSCGRCAGRAQSVCRHGYTANTLYRLRSSHIMYECIVLPPFTRRKDWWPHQSRNKMKLWMRIETWWPSAVKQWDRRNKNNRRKMTVFFFLLALVSVYLRCSALSAMALIPLFRVCVCADAESEGRTIAEHKTQAFYSVPGATVVCTICENGINALLSWRRALVLAYAFGTRATTNVRSANVGDGIWYGTNWQPTCQAVSRMLPFHLNDIWKIWTATATMFALCPTLVGKLRDVHKMFGLFVARCSPPMWREHEKQNHECRMLHGRVIRFRCHRTAYTEDKRPRFWGRVQVWCIYTWDFMKWF